MQYLRRGEWHQLVRITGPRHNLLWLRLSDGDEPVSLPHVERIQDPRGDATPELHDQDVAAAVIAGVSRANEKLGTAFAATHVRYVESDSPPASNYELLAEELVKRAASERGGDLLQAAG
jgi:hypothetical protein